MENYIFAVLRGFGDVFLIAVSYAIASQYIYRYSFSSSRLPKYIGVIVCASLLSFPYTGLDLDTRIEIFVKITLAGFGGIYDGLRNKEKNQT